jgi:xanthine/uracil permease
MNFNHLRTDLWKKSLLWAVVIEATLFACGVYTGAISRGPHDPMALLFGISQGVGLLLMGPITIVLSSALPEHQASAIAWTGVFVVQSLFLTTLIWRVRSFRNRNQTRPVRENR